MAKRITDLAQEYPLHPIQLSRCYASLSRPLPARWEPRPVLEISHACG